jgi:cysteine desulfurase / selenocysteine lyase
MTIGEARKQFPHTWTDKIYFNHGAISPIPFCVREAVGKYLEKRSLSDIECFPWAPKMAFETKKLIASRLGTSPTRIAYVLNTADGLNVLASGLVWEKGDRILLYKYEYPTNVYPFLIRKRDGVEIDLYDAPDHRITADVIKEHLTPDTKLLSLSMVQFSTGYQADIEAIGKLCKERGIIFSLDAIQAFPYMSFDIEKWNVDFISVGGHKWLMTPEGVGFIYVSEHMQDLIRQSWMGSTSVKNPFDHFNYDIERVRPDASRYENGTLNYPGIVALKASLEFQQEFGFDEVQKQTLFLTSRLAELFSARGANVISPQGKNETSGIIAVEIENADEVWKKLTAKDIHVAVRRGFLRMSPYFYNTEEEVKKVVDAVFE